MPRRPLVLHALTIAGVLYGATGCDAPLAAIRRAPPDGIDGRAIRASVWAPDFVLQGTGGPFSLVTENARDNVLLVFYRGHW